MAFAGKMNWLLPALVLLVLHWVSREALWQRATVISGGVVFPPVAGIRALYGMGVPLFGFGGTRVLLSDDKPEFALAFLLYGFLVLLLSTWPGTIRVDDSGIRQSLYFGLRRQFIAWHDVERAVFIASEATTYVYSKTGHEIRHTRYHVDPCRFRSEFKERSTVELWNEAFTPV